MPLPCSPGPGEKAREASCLALKYCGSTIDDAMERWHPQVSTISNQTLCLLMFVVKTKARAAAYIEPQTLKQSTKSFLQRYINGRDMRRKNIWSYPLEQSSDPDIADKICATENYVMERLLDYTFKKQARERHTVTSRSIPTREEYVFVKAEQVFEMILEGIVGSVRKDPKWEWPDQAQVDAIIDSVLQRVESESDDDNDK